MSESALVCLLDDGHGKRAAQFLAKVTENAGKGNTGAVQLFGPW